jgi:hypothetical protein
MGNGLLPAAGRSQGAEVSASPGSRPHPGPEYQGDSDGGEDASTRGLTRQADPRNPVLRLACAGRTNSASGPQPGRPPAMPPAREGCTHWVTPRRPGAGPAPVRSPAPGGATRHKAGRFRVPTQPGGCRRQAAGGAGPAPGRVHSHEGRLGVSRRLGRKPRGPWTTGIPADLVKWPSDSRPRARRASSRTWRRIGRRCEYEPVATRAAAPLGWGRAPARTPPAC